MRVMNKDATKEGRNSNYNLVMYCRPDWKQVSQSFYDKGQLEATNYKRVISLRSLG